MNKKIIHFLAFGAIIAFLAGIHTNASATSYKYNKIPVKSPVITKGMKSGVTKYNSGNYVGAIQDLQSYIVSLPKKQENATNAAYSLYYIALSYTQLGYKGEASELYRLIAESNVNYALTHYSNIALNCIDTDGTNETCSNKIYKAPSLEEIAKANEELNAGKDDMTKFIESGRKIHPAALDRITKERMERKIQADAYTQKEIK